VLSAKALRQGLQLDRLSEHGIVAVPLDEIGAAHEGTMFGSSSIIVPEIEIEEIDPAGKGRAFQKAVRAQTVDNSFSFGNALIGDFDHLLGLLVHAVDDGLGVALRADLLHVGLRVDIIRPLAGNGVGQVERETLRRIVRHLVSIDAAHVTGGAGGNPHVMGGELLRRFSQIQKHRLGIEQNSVLGFLIDFDLGVIGTHVTLAAGTGLASHCDGAGVPRVTSRAGADGAIGIRFADRVALLAAAGHGGSPFERCERMRRALGVSRMVLLSESDLVGREPSFPINGGPGNRGVAAAEELLVDRLMAAAAIRSRKVLGDDESVMLIAFLAGGGLMAFETTHPLHGVGAHLVLVDNTVLQAVMALGTLPGGANQLRIGLRGLSTRPRTVDQKSADGQREAKDNGDEDIPESLHMVQCTVIREGALDVPVVG